MKKFTLLFALALVTLFSASADTFTADFLPYVNQQSFIPQEGKTWSSTNAAVLSKTFDVTFTADSADNSKISIAKYFNSSKPISAKINWEAQTIAIAPMMQAIIQNAPVYICGGSAKDSIQGTLAVEKTATEDDSVIYDLTITCPKTVSFSVRGQVFDTFTMQFTGSVKMPAPIQGITSLDDIVNWSGTGTARAALVLQFNVDGEKTAMAFGYRFNPEDGKTAADMLEAIDAANPRLEVYSTSSTYGMLVNGFGWDTNNDGIVSTTDSTDYYRAGFQTSGYWSYWVRSDISAAWAYSNVGASGRKLTDGCWDGWRWSAGASDWKTIVSAPANSTVTGASDVQVAKSVAGVTYVNLAGAQSNEPFDGVNIMVVRYTDGTRCVKKIVK